MKLAREASMSEKKPGKRGRKPAAEGTERKTFKLSPAVLAELEAIRVYYGLTTEADAVRLAITATRRGLPKPKEES
jgi:hypothetical protein